MPTTGDAMNVAAIEMAANSWHNLETRVSGKIAALLWLEHGNVHWHAHLLSSAQGSILGSSNVLLADRTNSYPARHRGADAARTWRSLHGSCC